MDTLFGLPGHPLLAHLLVVTIPVAAILTVIIAVFPRVPALVRLTTLALGALAVVLVPFMQSSGKALEERLPDSPAVERHAEMGETLLPWVIALFVVIAAVLSADRWLRRPQSSGLGTPAVARRVTTSGRVVTACVAIAATAVAAGTLVQTVRIGHGGAQATWSTPGPVVPAPTQGGGGELGEQGEG